MSERTENGDVEASERLLGEKKRVSLSGDLDRTARPTKNKETTKQLKIVEKESEYLSAFWNILYTLRWCKKKTEITQKRALRQEKQSLTD